MQVMDIFELAAQYQRGEMTDDFILCHFGHEVLERLIHIVTDPFNDVLGG